MPFKLTMFRYDCIIENFAKGFSWMSRIGSRHLGCGGEAHAILGGWNRSQKILDVGAGAWNSGSRSTEMVCGASEFYK